MRRFTPFLVAAATGIASGVYIFKPLMENSNNTPSDPTKPVNSSGTLEKADDEAKNRSDTTSQKLSTESSASNENKSEKKA
ncbi:hypothetical protein C8Q75DRAFT_443957 [Abortiporus biennis]|nr:hypothetical protein C8Q75DRAFT_443957 [Abortiporus biennis]